MKSDSALIEDLSSAPSTHVQPLTTPAPVGMPSSGSVCTAHPHSPPTPTPPTLNKSFSKTKFKKKKQRFIFLVSEATAPTVCGYAESQGPGNSGEDGTHLPCAWRLEALLGCLIASYVPWSVPWWSHCLLLFWGSSPPMLTQKVHVLVFKIMYTSQDSS